ncbi:hypothetical protein QE152_g7387 [Popillia japonica]|uniref:G domain-containing protein n=1 Tax=Popillia japonica TaxID=7064 RepID=A0AAW1MFB8_POPJA
MVDSNEYNILLYGETGAGKSTFLNALDSYLKYSTLETGLHSKVCSRIALKFVWENDDYERVDVEFGCDIALKFVWETRI